MTFAERLKALRAESGLSQAELAKKAKLPLATVRGWEQGRREPSWANVVALANALAVPTDAFQPPAKFHRLPAK